MKKGSEDRVEGEKWEEASVYPFLWGNKNATRNSQHFHGGSTVGFLDKPSQGRSESLCPGQCFVLCLQTNAFFFPIRLRHAFLEDSVSMFLLQGIICCKKMIWRDSYLRRLFSNEFALMGLHRLNIPPSKSSNMLHASLGWRSYFFKCVIQVSVNLDSFLFTLSWRSPGDPCGQRSNVTIWPSLQSYCIEQSAEKLINP